MKLTRPIDPRAACVQALRKVIEQRRYLDAALDEEFSRRGLDTALVQEMAYGTLRWYYQLDAIAAQLLEKKPFKPKDIDLRLLLLVGLYQLRFMRIAPHAAVDETVGAVSVIGKSWAKGLINACLRSYLRSPGRADGIVERDPSARFSHPAWLVDKLREDHPERWEQIVIANNERAPMVLRVNARKQSREQYLERLAAEGIFARALDGSDTAIALETPVPVTALPGFRDGDVSVQDAAAQLAATLLDAQRGERVLDACAAPGGKTAHILERTPGVDLTALDEDEKRVAMIEQTLQRLQLTATVRTADATAIDTWWDGKPFDRVLIDAPCSASGVIRRHPDIKLRRQPEDFVALTATQARLLDALWPLLRPGGKLLYATCSVFADENERQIAAFLARHRDAIERPLALAAAQPRAHGMQILPGTETMDGFFYACIEKR